MAILGSAWEIRQVGPPNKVITLNSYQAPFGRLRKNPVVDTEFELRMSEVYYAGERVPTRHIFGDKESDIQLKGRWSDQYLGQGGAIQLAKTVKTVIQDQVQCTVKWGQILAYTGMPWKLRVGIEDNANLVWELSIKVDEDLDLPKVVPNFDGIPKSPGISVNDITAGLAAMLSRVAQKPISADLDPNFLDQLFSLLTSLRNAEAAFYDASADLQDYLTASNEQLGRLLGSIQALEAAVQNVSNAVDTVTLDAITYARTAETDYAWLDYKNSSDYAAQFVLYDLAQMQRQVVLAQQGTNQVTYRAQDGDTWESISIAVYGQADGANTLRTANGVATLRQANGSKYGSQPIPGKEYVVPLTALTF